MPAAQEWDERVMLRHLMRHVVPIYFEFTKGRELHKQLITTFVISINGRWLLMTAGHCITEVQHYRDNGYVISRCNLIDSLGVGATYKDPVPLDYDDSKPTALCSNPTWDYGVIIPRRNTCLLMQANGVVPMSKDWWNREDDVAEAYWMLGIPAEQVVHSGKMGQAGLTFARLEEIEDRPEGFPETDAPMFYGSLLKNPLSSLKGFSGSPIFSFARAEVGGHYQLHAMQVSALRGKYISGMLMQPLVEFLQEVSDGKHPEVALPPASEEPTSTE
jgi:hypothetical protein